MYVVQSEKPNQGCSTVLLAQCWLVPEVKQSPVSFFLDTLLLSHLLPLKKRKSTNFLFITDNNSLQCKLELIKVVQNMFSSKEDQNWTWMCCDFLTRTSDEGPGLHALDNEVFLWRQNLVPERLTRLRPPVVNVAVQPQPITPEKGKIAGRFRKRQSNVCSQREFLQWSQLASSFLVVCRNPGDYQPAVH